MNGEAWAMNGTLMVACNCDYGCPCNVNGRPTTGKCEGGWTWVVDTGRYASTTLDGLTFSILADWPGAIHEGGGHVVPIVDERANDAQRDALLRIMSGLDAVPGSNFFQVFSTTFEKMHDPVFAPIELDVDINGRSARFSVPGWVDARGEPIRNPVTGEEQRSRIGLPNGFEYDICEVGRGWATTQGPVDVQLADSHAHFAKLHMTESGVVH